VSKPDGSGTALAALIAGLFSTLDIATMVWFIVNPYQFGWWRWLMVFFAASSAIGFSSLSDKLLRRYDTE
jgi:hypothetical protein